MSVCHKRERHTHVIRSPALSWGFSGKKGEQKKRKKRERESDLPWFERIEKRPRVVSRAVVPAWLHMLGTASALTPFSSLFILLLLSLSLSFWVAFANTPWTAEAASRQSALVKRNL